MMQNESSAQQPRVGYTAARAKSAYMVNKYEGLNDRELMAEAARIMVQKLSLGRDSYRIRKFDEMTAHHAKIFSILALLIETLQQAAPNMEPEALKVSRQLNRFYRSLNKRLILILNHHSVEDEFAVMINELTEFYKLWMPKEQAPATNSHAEATAAVAGLGQIFG